jgi:hypothetical protein
MCRRLFVLVVFALLICASCATREEKFAKNALVEELNAKGFGAERVHVRSHWKEGCVTLVCARCSGRDLTGDSGRFSDDWAMLLYDNKGSLVNYFSAQGCEDNDSKNLKEIAASANASHSCALK